MTSAWADGYNAGYALAGKRGDLWIVVFSVLSFVAGLFMGWWVL